MNKSDPIWIKLCLPIVKHKKHVNPNSSNHYDNHFDPLIFDYNLQQSLDYMKLCQSTDKLNNMVKESYSFLIRNKMSKCVYNSEEKKMKKSRKSGLAWPFNKKQASSKVNGEGDLQWNSSTKMSFRKFNINLFSKQELTSLFMSMLKQLYIKAPYTVGIFRKSANARICKELKIKLEEEKNTDLSDYPVTVIASVFKEILRSIPGGLLESKYYDEWLDAIKEEYNLMKREKVKKLLTKLSSFNYNVLKHFICVLWHIDDKSDENKMCSMNLAVCISPSLLTSNHISSKPCEEVSKLVPKLIAYLIDHSRELFGSSVIHLFDEKASRFNSDTDESDSLNSIQDGAKVDDISIESFERVLIEDASSSNHSSPCKEEVSFDNKMSLSNLSRDSGLTLSDTQLYNPEDGDSEFSETINCPPSLTSRLHPLLTKSVPHLDSTNHENVINLTFSYGRSVGVSIDGSCHDVVRKRRHIDPFGRSKINSPMSPYHLFSNAHSHYSSSSSSSSSSSNNTNTNNNSNNSNINSINHHTGTCQATKPPHQMIQFPKSYNCEMSVKEEESYQNLKNNASKYPRNGQRYRLRRPPLTAVLRTDAYTSPSSIRSLSSNPESLRKALSEKNLVQVDYNESNDSLTTHLCKMSANMVDVDPHLYTNLSTGSTPNHNDSVISTSSSESQLSSSNQCSPSGYSSVQLTPQIIPPSYKETMNRKEILARLHNKTSSARHLFSPATNEIFDHSIRAYHQDLKSGSNLITRAVPVRVKNNDSDSDNEIFSFNAKKKASLTRAVSERTPICDKESHLPVHVTNSSDSYLTPVHHNHRLHSNSRGGVSIQQRCAKDLTEDWRKEISLSVAKLRTLFNGNKTLESPKIGPVSVFVKNTHPIASSKESEINKSISNTFTSPNVNAKSKLMSKGKENQITVINITSSNMQRPESICSSGEESYV